jgi:hypothetical protein
MKKTLRTTFLCLTTLLTAPASAIAASGQYGPYDYLLPINEPQIIPNITMWAIDAECTIISNVQDNIIAVKALYKKGSVNDIQLKRGDTMVLSVDAGEVLHLKAESGARVELNNEGSEEITARCYASFDSKKAVAYSPML